MKIGPKYKICRRLGEQVFPKCQTTKFSISGSQNRPNSNQPRRNSSEYSSQLREKQKARYTYGINERQFSLYVKKSRVRENLYRALESRLDNVIFRLGFAPSRAAARQALTHGHIMVNDRRVNIPSYAVQVGDRISIRSGSREKGPFRNLAERLKDYQSPTWVNITGTGEGMIKALATMGEAEVNLNFDAIMDFYSRV
ncbi:MAG: 30S ribosomal protein S4 [Patescibacteria group bacterium]